MPQDDINSTRNGEALLRRRRRRTIAATLVPGFALLGMLLVARHLIEGPDSDRSSPTPVFAIIFAIAMIVGTAIAAVWHHHVIDEQDERAILWANTAGFYVATVSAMIADVFGMAGLAGPFQHTIVLIPAFAIALGTYMWLRFR